MKLAKQSGGPRCCRFLDLGAMLVASWCVMMFTHELGHVIGGMIGGGSLQAAELRPWRLAYSLFAPDPRPLLTLWAGPMLGVLLPFLAAVVFKSNRVWFVASFCLLANGSYLAIGWFAGDPFLDSPRLLAAGTPPLVLAAITILMTVSGHRLFRRSCQNLLAGPCGSIFDPSQDRTADADRIPDQASDRT
jgi:hypothetical protein